MGKSILEVQDDITGIKLSFRENKLEGSFLKKGNRYLFWAFFLSSNLTGICMRSVIHLLFIGISCVQTFSSTAILMCMYLNVAKPKPVADAEAKMSEKKPMKLCKPSPT